MDERWIADWEYELDGSSTSRDSVVRAIERDLARDCGNVGRHYRLVVAVSEVVSERETVSVVVVGDEAEG